MGYESINNHYETLVAVELHKQLGNTAEGGDSDYLEDVACVALNKLPPRYVRHQVDLSYYLTDEERAGMEEAARLAVSEALAFVSQHRQR